LFPVNRFFMTAIVRPLGKGGTCPPLVSFSTFVRDGVNGGGKAGIPGRGVGAGSSFLLPRFGVDGASGSAGAGNIDDASFEMGKEGGGIAALSSGIESGTVT
jgi:hypothetical protein